MEAKYLFILVIIIIIIYNFCVDLFINNHIQNFADIIYSVILSCIIAGVIFISSIHVTDGILILN